jgi:hypothetical protein
MTSVHDVTYDLLRRHGVKNLIIIGGRDVKWAPCLGNMPGPARDR